MRIRTKLLAATALVATLALGASVVPAVRAGELPSLNGFYVLDQDAFMVHLVVDAPAELAGAECTILQGQVPFGGDPVNGLILAEGVNMTFAPQIGPCWLTAIGPAFRGQTGQLGDTPASE